MVCPASLLGNWAREVARFAPDTPVRRYHGSGRSLEDLAGGELVITTYGVARRARADLWGSGFSLVVADEAQHAKNPMSDTARALRELGGEVRIALTGTPVENRLTELWSILDWTTPGLLGPLERFRRTVALPIEQRRDPEVTERLSRTVRPFLLRRKKTDPWIARGPPETDRHRPCREPDRRAGDSVRGRGARGAGRHPGKERHSTPGPRVPDAHRPQADL